MYTKQVVPYSRVSFRKFDAENLRRTNIEEPDHNAEQNPTISPVP